MSARTAGLAGFLAVLLLALLTGCSTWTPRARRAAELVAAGLVAGALAAHHADAPDRAPVLARHGCPGPRCLP
jgi:hypothetical protein